MITSGSFTEWMGMAGEGAGVKGAMRPDKKVDSHLRLLTAAGAVNGTGAARALETLDQVRAVTRRLLNPI